MQKRNAKALIEHAYLPRRGDTRERAQDRGPLKYAQSRHKVHEVVRLLTTSNGTSMCPLCLD